MIRLSVLGSVELRGSEGQALLSILSQPKRLTLLTYLVLNATDGFVRREKLLALFWPESDTGRARASLRQSFSYLRRSLGAEVLVTRGDEEVGIAAEGLRCDAVQFEEALDAGSSRAAWDFYGGPLLDGVHAAEPGVERWLEDERSRLGRRAVAAARLLAEQAESQGDLDDAVLWARKGLALEPLSEACVRQLIGLLGRAGDRDQAIRTYDSFATGLSKELGLEPADDTQALIHSVRTTSCAPISPVAVTAPGRPPKVEREPLGQRAAMRPPRRFGSLAGGILGFFVVALGAVLWGARRLPAPERVVRSIVVMAEGEDMVDLAGRRFALSPDGSQFVYVGAEEGRLWVRQRDQLNARTLPGTEGSVSPFISPEGDRVGFFSKGQLRILSLDGGPVVEVTNQVDMWQGSTWGSDGMLYAAGAGFGGLVRTQARQGAEPRVFTTLDSEKGETNHGWPDAHPGGKSVVFTVERVKAGVDGTVYSIAVGDIETGTHKLLFDGIFARHAGPAHLIYVTTDSTLMVVPFDFESLEVTGRPSVVSQGQRVGFRRSVDVSISASGTLMYATGRSAGNNELVWVARDGTVEPLDPLWTGDLRYPTISPDGSRFAVVAGREGASDIWIGDMGSGGRRELTTEHGASGYPSWTPDGLSVTYFARDSGAMNLWTKSADGSGRATQELSRPRDLAESVWSPDGEWLVYRTTNIPQPSLNRTGAPVAGAGDILATRPGVAGEPVPLATTEFPEFAPAFSPDGRWLAYTSNETGRREVFVIPFPALDGARWLVSSEGGIAPVWSRATGELFYRNSRHDMVAVEVTTSPTLSFGRTSVLFEGGGYLADGLHSMYSVTPDGSRFLMIRSEPRIPGDLVVVENWFQELGGPGERP